MSEIEQQERDKNAAAKAPQESDSAASLEQKNPADVKWEDSYFGKTELGKWIYTAPAKPKIEFKGVLGALNKHPEVLQKNAQDEQAAAEKEKLQDSFIVKKIKFLADEGPKRPRTQAEQDAINKRAKDDWNNSPFGMIYKYGSTPQDKPPVVPAL